MNIIQSVFCSTSTDDGAYPAAVVAVGTEAEWSAYMGGYPMYVGQKHGAEMVARNGDKMTKRAATALFPALPADNYRE